MAKIVIWNSRYTKYEMRFAQKKIKGNAFRFYGGLLISMAIVTSNEINS